MLTSWSDADVKCDQMPRQAVKAEEVEQAAPDAYAEMSPQQKGGFMLWLKSNISEILSLMKDIRAEQKQIPSEVQKLLDEIALHEKAIDDIKKKVYTKAKEIKLRQDIEVELSKLTYVKKFLNLSVEEYYAELRPRFVDVLLRGGIPEVDVQRIVSLLDATHSEALTAKKLQESYTLYAKLE